MWGWWWACRAPSTTPEPPPDPVHTAGPGHSAGPVHSGVPPAGHTADDCVPAPTLLATYRFDLFEDFEVLPDDTIVTGANGALLRWVPEGPPPGAWPVPGFDNPTGLRRLPDGRLAFADAFVGAVAALDPTTGSTLRSPPGS